MCSTIKGLCVVSAAACLGTSVLGQQQAGDTKEVVGYNALAARLGPSMPTGQPLAVVQVEGKFEQYGPHQSNPEFAGKTFVPMAGSPGVSSHATTVGRRYYGLDTSLSPAVPLVYMWYPANWVLSYLNSSSISTVPPNAPPENARVFNHSWALNGGNGYNNLALRRSDYVMEVYGVLMVAGVVNPPKPFESLMAGSYNGISVGLANGNHTPGPVPTGTDGAGRMKPEIVAPSTLTSFATPIVGAAVTLLFETAMTMPRVAGNPDAEAPEVIKASLLAGATHREGWSNGAPSSGPQRGITEMPLDPVYGVDLLNIDRAHRILGGGSQSGATDPEGAMSVERMGWERPTVFSGSSRFYRIHVPSRAPFVSVIATWNRVFPEDWTAFYVADFDLHLWRIGRAGALLPMTGDAGTAFFASGNVSSVSSVDNVEHLYIRDLEPGTYMLELRRMDDGPPVNAAVAWYRATEATQGDINEDTVVNGRDMGTLLSQWGTLGVSGDINGDGIINGVDLAKLLADW